MRIIPSGLYNITEGSKEKMRPRKAMRNKEMGSYKASRGFNVPQTTLERYVKDRQRSSREAIKKVGRKQVLRCEVEKDLAEYCLLMERKFFGLTMADVMRLAYQRN